MRVEHHSCIPDRSRSQIGIGNSAKLKIFLSKPQGQVGWVGLMFVLFVALYFHSSTAQILIAMLSLGLVLFVDSTPPMRSADWYVLVLILFQVPFFFVSEYGANSIHSLGGMAIAVAVYYVTRTTIRKNLQVAYLSGAVAVGGSLLAFSGIYQFSRSARILSASGFANLVDFRSRLILPPNPWITGEWFTLLLLTLPFACAVPAFLWQHRVRWAAALSTIPSILIGAVTTLSLSRAVFWSMAAFVVLMCGMMALSRVFTVRAVWTTFATSILMLSLIVGCESLISPGVSKAYLYRQKSQTRSAEGRVRIWQKSVHVIKEHPLFGVGSSNAALALLSSANGKETVGFASRTFSLPVQILVEHGIIGLVVFTIFPLLLAWELFKVWNIESHASDVDFKVYRNKQYSAEYSARTAMICCFGAGFVAVICRELFYSSLFEHTLTLALMATLSALTLLGVDRG